MNMFPETLYSADICILDEDTISNAARAPSLVVAKYSPPGLQLRQKLLADLQYLAPLCGGCSHPTPLCFTAPPDIS